MTTTTIHLADIGNSQIDGKQVAIYADVKIGVKHDLQTVVRTLDRVYVAKSGTENVTPLDAIFNTLNIAAVSGAAFDEFVEAVNEARDRLAALDVTVP